MDGKPRVAIMNVAMHLFGKQGFNGTSMRDIANAVGLLPGSLYAHIESKEALLLEIVADGIGRFLAAVEPHVASSGNPLDRLRKMIIAHVEVVADNPERSQVVFHQWRFLSPEYLPEAIERRRRYETCFVEVIEEGVKANITLFATEGKSTFTKENILSKSKNSAFLGTEIKGSVYGILNQNQLVTK